VLVGGSVAEGPLTTSGSAEAEDWTVEARCAPPTPAAASGRWSRHGRRARGAGGGRQGGPSPPAMTPRGP